MAKYTAKQLVKLKVLTQTPVKHVREVEKGQYTTGIEALMNPRTTVTETDYHIELTDEAERLLQPLLRKVDATGLSQALATLLNRSST